MNIFGHTPCLSDPDPIRPHLTYMERDYTILLLFINVLGALWSQELWLGTTALETKRLVPLRLIIKLYHLIV